MGKLPKHSSGFHTDHNWSKQSILWQLPYWSFLLVRHNLDVMHNEKIVFDNVANNVMDVIGKSEDNVSARRDLKLYCNRRALHPKEDKCDATIKLVMPKASYVLTKEERVVVCSWIRLLRF